MKCVFCIQPIQVHTHLEQWAADTGEQLGVRCLAQESHLSRGQFLPEPRFEPTTSGYIRATTAPSSLHLTHPKCIRTRSSGQPCYGARGAVRGSVPCSRLHDFNTTTAPQNSIPAGPRLEPANFRLQARLSNH